MNITRKAIATSLCALMVASALPFSASAASTETVPPKWNFGTMVEIPETSGINFSREPSEEQKQILMEHYRQESEAVFNEAYAAELYARDQAKIAAVSDDMRAVLYCKEIGTGDVYDTAASTSSKALGTVGDILVTYSFSSLGVNVAAFGHAAIVSEISTTTIESFPESKSKGHADGVRPYPNTWKDKKNVYGLRVSGAKSKDYTKAAQYAKKQADAKKGYNWNFFNKGTTNKFYCSQLVWRAWKEAGYDVDWFNPGNWEPVSPAELVKSSKTYAFYTK